MSLRVILIAAGIVSVIFGLFFLLGADTAIQSYNLGDSTLPARLFARAEGVSLITFGIVNLLAATDTGSRALRAIVIGNLLIHVLSLGVDFSETYARSAGTWIGVAVHVVFIVAFGYALMNWRKMTTT